MKDEGWGLALPILFRLSAFAFSLRFMSDHSSLPAPEELERKLDEILATQFPEEEREFVEAAEEKTDPFVFDKLPRDIKGYLDRFVIRQDEAKKVLSIAVCDHYNHIRYLRTLAAEDAERAQR